LIEKYNLNPAESVFIDDLEANAEAAREVGLNAIHFTNIDEVKTKLNELLDK